MCGQQWVLVYRPKPDCRPKPADNSKEKLSSSGMRKWSVIITSIKCSPRTRASFSVVWWFVVVRGGSWW